MQIRSDQGEEMFTISGLDDVWVMADVYESDIRQSMCRRQGGDYYTGLSEQEFRRHYRQSVSGAE